MTDNIIKQINNQYEKKRNLAFNELVNRKKEIYSSFPRLKEIENEINSYAIQSAKAILLAEGSEKYSYTKDLEDKIDILINERNEILKKENIALTDLEPKFECPLCNDTGFINNEKCACFTQQLLNLSYNDSNLQSFKNQTFENFDASLYSTEKNIKYNISPQERAFAIKTNALTFINNFDDASQKNLLFSGGTGLGKTYLSSAIANELLKKNKTVLYQTAPILVNTIINYKFNKSTEAEKIYNEIFNVDLLIIDDLGVEPSNNIIFAELFTIINSRLLNSKKITKTIISTNLSLEDLYNRYEERLVSRIIGHYSSFMFIGDDIRLKQKK